MTTFAEDDQRPGVASAAPPRIAPGGWRRWLAAGWRDLQNHRRQGLRYGLGVVAGLWSAAAALFLLGLEWMLPPGLAGAMLMGPAIASGLYRIVDEEESRSDAEPGGGQLLLVGAVLLALLLTWLRAATLLYALFFGLTPFPGLPAQFELLAGTFEGRALVLVGAAVGGLFAALAFAISAFSIPMLRARDIDAFTAMGRSFSAVAHNFQEAVKWAAAVLVLSLVCAATGLLALVWVFPWLGFASWRAYQDVFERRRAPATDAR